MLAQLVGWFTLFAGAVFHLCDEIVDFLVRCLRREEHLISNKYLDRSYNFKKCIFQLTEFAGDL